jgi:glycosyltransferase involved in cell wall biosynthesis
VFAPRLGHIPVIYEVHDLESRNPSRAKEAWAQGLLHLLDRTALTRSTAVASLTTDFERYLDSISWRTPEEVFVVPDGYDEQLFIPRDRAASRAALNLPADAPLLVYAGMTFSHRWLDGLLRAAAQLLPTFPDLRVVLVGGRHDEIIALQSCTVALDMEEHVLLVGPRPQSEIVAYLSAADVLAIPDTVTDMTASPLKLFEYLAMGAPLVLPDLPALHEVVGPDLAHFFPRRSLEGLTCALRAAFDARTDEASSTARQRLAQNYTYGRRAERILAIAEQVRRA